MLKIFSSRIDGKTFASSSDLHAWSKKLTIVLIVFTSLAKYTFLSSFGPDSVALLALTQNLLSISSYGLFAMSYSFFTTVTLLDFDARTI